MSALFSRRSNRALAAACAGLAGIVVAIPTCLMVGARTPYGTGQFRPMAQPVAFDHRHHVRDDGIDCRYCHDLAWRSPYAGVPPTERCIGCHAQIWNQSPLLAAVWESHRTGRPIEWVRVHRLPDFVYFDHSVHVRAGVGCESCHGRVDRMARVYQVASLQMDWCLDCHRDPDPHLRPPARVTDMGLPPADGTLLARRSGVEPGTDCTTCHR